MTVLSLHIYNPCDICVHGVVLSETEYVCNNSTYPSLGSSKSLFSNI